LPGKAARPTLTFTTNEHNVVEFFQHGKDNQAPNPTKDSPLLNNAGKKRIQQIVGSFLYYARAVKLTILMALSDIATQQSAPTKNTKKQVKQFID
jgi:hypothetical protein